MDLAPNKVYYTPNFGQQISPKFGHFDPLPVFRLKNHLHFRFQIQILHVLEAQLFWLHAKSDLRGNDPA